LGIVLVYPFDLPGHRSAETGLGPFASAVAAADAFAEVLEYHWIQGMGLGLHYPNSCASVYVQVVYFHFGYFPNRPTVRQLKLTDSQRSHTPAEFG